MALFPLFIDLSGEPVLVVGGGEVATRKVENLLPFNPRITVVSPRLTPRLQKLAREGKVRWIRRPFRSSDLKGKKLVVVAVDKPQLHRRIHRMCKKRGILCNSVDSPRYCTFIFPSIVKRGELVVGISSSGKVPALSRAVREYLEKVLPEGLGELLAELEKKRREGVKGKRLLELARDRLRSLGGER